MAVLGRSVKRVCCVLCRRRYKHDTTVRSGLFRTFLSWYIFESEFVQNLKGVRHKTTKCLVSAATVTTAAAAAVASSRAMTK